MEETQFYSDMHVELVQSQATDASVVFAARVSTIAERSIPVEARPDVTTDAGLINYLMRSRHGSPFEHNLMTFFVQAPIFVFRELMRHRIASYNEESGRYREMEPTFYSPGPERKLHQVGRPGHYTFEDADPSVIEETQGLIEFASHQAYSIYRELLERGVAREVARIVLPLNLFSSAYVTMNARALMNLLSLRTTHEQARFPSFPQREIEMVAERMERHWAGLMPITHGAWHTNGRIAP